MIRARSSSARAQSNVLWLDVHNSKLPSESISEPVRLPCTVAMLDTQDSQTRTHAHTHVCIIMQVDEASQQALQDAGLDPALARHIAHLFTRDPLVMFEGRIEELDDT